MRPTLPPNHLELVVCPLCKTRLDWTSAKASCTSCGGDFHETNGVWSFMPRRPAFLGAGGWHEGQKAWEEWQRDHSDALQIYLDEIESVREIYTEVFSLAGSVLDVGGFDGRLRHFLAPETPYLIVDPDATAFSTFDRKPNLTKAYPRLAEPSPFLHATAERLPVASSTFDVVHMRSVIDHFEDPLYALWEARRVLKPRGSLLVGVHVTGGQSSLATDHGIRGLGDRIRKKVRDEGVTAATIAAARRLVHRDHDAHIWHPAYDTLLELIRAAGFEIEKEHWQKPPNDHVIYVMAKAPHARI